MSTRLKQAAVIFVAVFSAAQLIRPGRSNPPTDETRTLQAQTGAASGVAAVVDRSCRDCHSNNTVWRSYTQVAPLSWLMAYAVSSGRRAVNFSEWTAYSEAQQRMLLAASCDDATSGKMPGVYSRLQPETRLSVQDVESICAAARRSAAAASR